MSAHIILIDTNAIIEAVRCGFWAALAGALPIETVRACQEECLAGDEISTGYVAVTEDQLMRIKVHDVSPEQRAVLLLNESAGGLDRGEFDLFARALSTTGKPLQLCSPDRAFIHCAVEMGWGDCLVSLQEVLKAVGIRKQDCLRRHFTHNWLAKTRTEAVLRSRL